MPPILDPRELPAITELRRRAQALAMLDAIVCPEWDYRYYSFNARWSPGSAMGSMRDGCGDGFFILFGPWDAAIKGLAHETALARDPTFAAAVQASVPQSFAGFLSEPAFGMDRLSYCYWRAAVDPGWQKVAHPDPALASADGSTAHLAALIGAPTSYAEYAAGYFERDLPIAAIADVHAHVPLTDRLVRTLNPGLTLAQLRADAAEIGYPVEAP